MRETDRIEQKTLNGLKHGNGFLYISECETLITPSDCCRAAVAYNLKRLAIVGQR